MKSLYSLILSVFLIGGCFSCSTKMSKNELTPEQQDSIAKVKQDSIKLADSVAAIEQHRADSIALVKQTTLFICLYIFLRLKIVQLYIIHG